MTRIPSRFGLPGFKTRSASLQIPFSNTPFRLFSTSFPQLKNVSSKNVTHNTPPYPHGERHLYRQSNHGLYGLARVRFGNSVADSEFKTKTRRRWHPNVHKKKVFSEALDSSLKIKMTARVLRTIDKVGGLDNYLLGDKSRRIKELGPKGWQLRWRIMQTNAVQEKFRKQREELGLDAQQANALHETVKRHFDVLQGKRLSPLEEWERNMSRNARRDILRLTHPKTQHKSKKWVFDLDSRVARSEKAMWKLSDEQRILHTLIRANFPIEDIAIKDGNSNKIEDPSLLLTDTKETMGAQTAEVLESDAHDINNDTPVKIRISLLNKHINQVIKSIQLDKPETPLYVKLLQNQL